MPSAPDPTSVPVEERAGLERLAAELARVAGDLVRDERPSRLDVSATKTSELDVVTVMDGRSEQLLRDLLARRRPEDGVLGEEEGLVPGTSGLSWVLDPIDGTVNYLYDLPAYAVSVALVVGNPEVEGAWAPVAGAVANPRTRELFSAHAGGGARLAQEHPLRVTEVADLGAALLATGFAYDRRVRHEQAAVVADLLPRVRDVRRMGAAALDLCHVAAGRVDGYWETGTNVWDMAAGVLVVTEAGGVVTGQAPGSAPGKDMVVAAGKGLHERLRSEVARLRAR